MGRRFTYQLERAIIGSLLTESMKLNQAQFVEQKMITLLMFLFVVAPPNVTLISTVICYLVCHIFANLFSDPLYHCSALHYVWDVAHLVTSTIWPTPLYSVLCRVVFLDKPLPPRSMTCIERNMRVHKRTARILVCKRVTGPGPVDYTIWADHTDRRQTQ